MFNLPSIDWIGTNLGILGSLLLATKTRISPLGWVAYLGSNLAWLLYGLSTGIGSISTQYLWYMGTTGLAIFRHRGEIATLFAVMARPLVFKRPDTSAGGGVTPDR
jgi:hypothetical protein